MPTRGWRSPGCWTCIGGKLKLDELVTSTYKLEDVGAGYADLAAGRNLRGLVVYTHSDR